MADDTSKGRINFSLALPADLVAEMRRAMKQHGVRWAAEIRPFIEGRLKELREGKT